MLAACQQEAFSRGILSLICLVMGQMRSSAAGRRGGGKIAYQLLHANHKSRKKCRFYPASGLIFSVRSHASSRAIPSSVVTCSRYPSTASARLWANQ